MQKCMFSLSKCKWHFKISDSHASTLNFVDLEAYTHFHDPFVLYVIVTAYANKVYQT